MKRTEVRNAFQVREFLRSQMTMTAPGMLLTKGAKGAVIGMLNKYLFGDNNRKLVLGWLFGDKDKLAPLSTKALTEDQWLRISDWVGMWHDIETDQWYPSGEFQREAGAVLTETIKVYNALTNSERDKLPPIDPQMQAAVDVGGVISNANSTEAIETPTFDKLIGQTGLGELFKRNKDVPF